MSMVAIRYGVCDTFSSVSVVKECPASNSEKQCGRSNVITVIWNTFRTFLVAILLRYVAKGVADLEMNTVVLEIRKLAVNKANVITIFVGSEELSPMFLVVRLPAS